MKTIIKFGLVLSIILFALSCSDETELRDVKIVNYQGRSVNLSDNYVQLNPGDTKITNYDNSTGIVEIEFSGVEPNFVEGKSILSVDLDTIGYLRKVVKILKNGSSLRLTTETATLPDVFVNTNFKLKTELMEPKSALKATSTNEEIYEALKDENGFVHPVKILLETDNGNKIVYSALNEPSLKSGDIRERLLSITNDFSGTDIIGTAEEDVHLYIDEGHANFFADGVFEFDFGVEIEEGVELDKGDINSFKFYIDAEADFLTKFGLDITKVYEKKLDEPKKIYNFHEKHVKFIVAGVPVWISFDCDFYVDYTVNASAEMNASWGFQSNHTLQTGCDYNIEYNDISPIYEYTPTNDVFPLIIEGNVNAAAHVELFPRVDIKFYDFIGPFVEVSPYANGLFNFGFLEDYGNGDSFRAWNSNVNVGLDLRVGAELDFIGLWDKEYGPYTEECFNLTLWEAPKQIELFSTIPDIIKENEKLLLTYKVKDNLGDNTMLVPVYFSGDGSADKDFYISDLKGEIQVEWTPSIQKKVQNITTSIFNADGTLAIKNDLSINVEATELVLNDFMITSSTHDGTENWDDVIQQKYGSEYRIADWNDLQIYYNNGGDLLALFDDLGLTEYDNSVALTRSGSQSYSSTRYYFASRHEGHLPTNYSYMSHDDIGNHILSLGSWQGKRKLLAIKKSSGDNSNNLSDNFDDGDYTTTP